MKTLHPRRSKAHLATVAAVLVGAPVVVGGLLVASEAPARAADVGIAVIDNAYDPREVTVELGDTLVFRWEGTNPHSANGPWGSPHPGCSAATTPACADRGDPPFRFTTDEVGTFSYNCPVHVDMRGTFTVLAPDDEPTPDPSPSPSPSPSASPEPSQEPSSEPSPEPTVVPTIQPTAEPSPEPSPSPSPEPEPSPSPSSEPDPRFTVGPPPPRETEPPVVVEPTGPEPSDTPRPTVTLEPFPEGVDPDRVVASEEASARQDLAAALEQDRRVTVPRWIAIALVLGTLVAFVQFILFGPAWVTEDQAAGGDEPRD